MLATAVLLVVGAIIFWAAMTVQGFVAAGLVLAAGLASYVGARKLKPTRAAEDMQALADYLGGKKPNGN